MGLWVKAVNRDLLAFVAERNGELPEGYEWLSVIFRDQKCDDVDSLEQLIECSGRFVREAYVRMPR